MDFSKLFIVLALLVACAFALPSPASPAEVKIDKLKSGVKRPALRLPVTDALQRTRRQFGFGGSGASSFASANSGSFGGSPYGGFGYPGFGGSNSFASANAGSSAFGR